MSGDIVIAEPTSISGLPRDKHGRRVPWFVAWIDGVPDFRVVRERGIMEAYRRNLCWVCGTDRGREAAFVLGPMCTVNRVAPEPPSHRACATYSAKVCPFLATPTRRRRERGLPEDRLPNSEYADQGNPGVAVVWFCTTWKPFPIGDGGVLFEIGPPTRVNWFAHGRAEAALEAGVARLDAMDKEQGLDPRQELVGRLRDARALLPKA
jgi:hypothetical protein